MSFFRDLLIEKKRKPYYCEVEYLESTGESTGTQWIDTGINVDTSTDEIKLYFQLTDTALYKWFFGEYDTNARLGLGSGDGADKRNFLYQQSATKVSDTQMYDKQHLFEINSNGGFLDGTKIRDYLSFASTSSIYLFNLNIDSPSDYRCKSKIWKYEHKRNGVLIRDMVGVLDWNMTPCMYDKVSRKLFYNKGTGNFSYGREIHPVDYIEAENGGSTVVQYAVGNYRLTNTTDWEITFSASNSNNSWVMGQPTWIGVHYRKDTTTSNLPRVGITNGAASASQCYVDYTDNEKITLALKGTDVYANGVKAGSITRASAGATQTKYGIFAYKDIGQDLPNLRIQSARIYRLKIWDNNVLVQDLTPAIDENGVGGFFENVSRTFIEKESNSTSEFSYPPVELEYIESTGVEYIDTGIKFDCANTKIELKTYEDSLTRIHSICGDDGNCFYYFRGTGNWAVGYNNTASNVSSYMVVGDNVFVIDKNNVYLNGVLATTYTASSTISSYNTLLFNRKTSLVDKGAVTMYYCKIWNGSTIVRDYIPVFYNGQAGMWDKANNVFYPNAGTGTFVAGSVIESRWF